MCSGKCYGHGHTSHTCAVATEQDRSEISVACFVTYYNNPLPINHVHITNQLFRSGILVETLLLARSRFLHLQITNILTMQWSPAGIDSNVIYVLVVIKYDDTVGNYPTSIVVAGILSNFSLAGGYFWQIPKRKFPVTQYLTNFSHIRSICEVRFYSCIHFKIILFINQFCSLHMSHHSSENEIGRTFSC